MTKSNAHPNIHRHFFAWFVALFVFAFFEWRHTGFVSYVFPFPVLVFIPLGILIVEYGYSLCSKKL